MLNFDSRILDLNLIRRQVYITRDEYIRLKMAAYKLQLLEVAGVDNWTWYGDALYRPEGAISVKEMEETLERETPKD